MKGRHAGDSNRTEATVKLPIFRKMCTRKHLRERRLKIWVLGWIGRNFQWIYWVAFSLLTFWGGTPPRVVLVARLPTGSETAEGCSGKCAPTKSMDEHLVVGLPALEPYARLFHSYVIDSGFVKQQQYNPSTGMYSLDVVQISNVQDVKFDYGSDQ